MPASAPSVPGGAAAARPSAPRVRSIDWHRTLVVFVMIECHALVFLKATHDAEPLRAFLNGINGLVAPSFLFLAGTSLGYGFGLAQDAAGRAARLRGSLRRIVDVLLAATFLRCNSSPALTAPEWRWWLQVDVLSCIAYSLLLLQLLFRLLGGRPAVAGVVAWGAAAALFAAAPFTERVRDAGPLIYFLNGSEGSMFPLAPWAALVFLGGAAGLALARGGRRGYRAFLVGTGAVFGAVAFAGDSVRALYAVPEAWILPNGAERVWKFCAIALVLDLLESAPGVAARADASRLVRGLTLFGRASLSAYVFHLLFIYGAFGLKLVNGFHGRTDWGVYAALTALTLAATWLFCAALEAFERRRKAARAAARA